MKYIYLNGQELHGMNDLLIKIIDYKPNRSVLQFLKVDLSNKSIHFQPWEQTSHGYDQGGIALFDQFGKTIPSECKYSLDIHNLMISPVSGEIFAFHTGRYSLFFKCNFEFFNLSNTDNFRKGYTLDEITDITPLGPEWAFMDHFEGSESEQLERAFGIRKK